MATAETRPSTTVGARSGENSRFAEGVKVKLGSKEVSPTRYSLDGKVVVSARYEAVGKPGKPFFLRLLSSTEMPSTPPTKTEDVLDFLEPIEATETPSLRQTGPQDVLLPQMERLVGIIAPGLVIDARAVEYVDDVEARAVVVKEKVVEGGKEVEKEIREGGKVLAKEMGKVGIQGKENAVEGVSAETITVSDEASLTLSGELGGGRIKGGIVSAETVSGRVYLQGIKESKERKEKAVGELTVGTVDKEAAVSVGEESKLVATTIAGNTYVDGTSASVVVDTVTGQLKAAHGAKVTIGTGKVTVTFGTAEINGEIKGPGEHAYGEPIGADGVSGREILVSLMETMLGRLSASRADRGEAAGSLTVNASVSEPEVPFSTTGRKVVDGKLREVHEYRGDGYSFAVLGRGKMIVTRMPDGSFVVTGEGAYKVDLGAAGNDNGDLKVLLNPPALPSATDLRSASAVDTPDVPDYLREFFGSSVTYVEGVPVVGNASSRDQDTRKAAPLPATTREDAHQRLREVPDSTSAALRERIPADAVAQLDTDTAAVSFDPARDLTPALTDTIRAATDLDIAQAQRPQVTRRSGLGSPLVDMASILASRQASNTTAPVAAKPDFTLLTDKEIDQRDREADIREAGRAVRYPETPGYPNPLGIVKRWGLGLNGIQTGDRELELAQGVPVAPADGDERVFQTEAEALTAIHGMASEVLATRIAALSPRDRGLFEASLKARAAVRGARRGTAEPEAEPAASERPGVVETRRELDVVFDIADLPNGDSGAAHMMRNPDNGQAISRVVRREPLSSVFQQWGSSDAAAQTVVSQAGTVGAPTAEAPVAKPVALELSEDQTRQIDLAVDRILRGDRREISFRAEDAQRLFGLPVGATMAEQEFIIETFIAKVDTVRRARQAARQRARDVVDFS